MEKWPIPGCRPGKCRVHLKCLVMPKSNNVFAE